MRLDIVNHTSYPDAPIYEIHEAVGAQLFHFAWLWPGASRVVTDLQHQGFYIEVVDDLAEQGILGYHSVDDDGRSFSQVAANPSLQNGSDWLTGTYSVASVIGHEALETVGNPLVNVWRDMFTTPSRLVAQEVCDPVEDCSHNWHGVQVTDYVLPSWFNPFGKHPFDAMGVLDAPFAMSAGGYMVVLQGGNEENEFAHAEVGSSMPAWRREAVHARAQMLGINTLA